MKGYLLTGLATTVLGLAITATSAQALSVTPATADFTQTAPGNCDANCVEGLLATNGFGTIELTEVYKQNAGGSEEFGFAGSYTTAFNSDLSGFTITYDGVPDPTISCPFCVLFVKDGTPQPQYFFVTAMSSWNGTETITGSGFYPAQGQISHVSIFSGDPGSSTVPEPTSLLLLGSGLVAFGLWRRNSAKA